MKLGKVNSQSKGVGLVATEDIAAITNLGEYLIKGGKITEDTMEVWDGWVETPILGRYLNHNRNPNTFPIMKDNKVIIYTKRHIENNEELTVNYLEIAALINLPDDKRESFGIKDFNYETK